MATSDNNGFFLFFNVKASLKDTETLFNALEWRLATLRAQQSRAAATAACSLPDADSSTTFPAVTHNEDGTSSPKRRALPVEPDEPGDETKKKRSEWHNNKKGYNVDSAAHVNLCNPYLCRVS